MVLCTAEFAHLLPMNVQHIVDGALDVLHGGSCLEGTSKLLAPERVSGLVSSENRKQEPGRSVLDIHMLQRLLHSTNW